MTDLGRGRAGEGGVQSDSSTLKIDMIVYRNSDTGAFRQPGPTIGHSICRNRYVGGIAQLGQCRTINAQASLTASSIIRIVKIGAPHPIRIHIGLNIKGDNQLSTSPAIIPFHNRIAGIVKTGCSNRFSTDNRLNLRGYFCPVRSLSAAGSRIHLCGKTPDLPIFANRKFKMVSQSIRQNGIAASCNSRHNALSNLSKNAFQRACVGCNQIVVIGGSLEIISDNPLVSAKQAVGIIKSQANAVCTNKVIGKIIQETVACRNIIVIKVILIDHSSNACGTPILANIAVAFVAGKRQRTFVFVTVQLGRIRTIENTNGIHSHTGILHTL